MTSHDDWPHRWFGFWKEERPGSLAGPDPKNPIMYPKFPSLAEYRDDGSQDEIRQSIVDYLKSGRVVRVVACGYQPCALCGDPVQAAAWETDETWLWPASLIHYVECHKIAVPSAFLEHMKKTSFAIPPGIEKKASKLLPWPGINISREEAAKLLAGTVDN